VTDGVHKCFTQRIQRKERLFDALESAGHYACGDRHVPLNESHRLFEQEKRMSTHLPAVNELALRRSTEASQAKNALWVVVEYRTGSE
jgi:hypothetical protein